MLKSELRWQLLGWSANHFKKEQAIKTKKKKARRKRRAPRCRGRDNAKITAASQNKNGEKKTTANKFICQPFTPAQTQNIRANGAPRRAESYKRLSWHGRRSVKIEQEQLKKKSSRLHAALPNVPAPPPFFFRHASFKSTRSQEEAVKTRKKKR